MAKFIANSEHYQPTKNPVIGDIISFYHRADKTYRYGIHIGDNICMLRLHNGIYFAHWWTVLYQYDYNEKKFWRPTKIINCNNTLFHWNIDTIGQKIEV